MWITRDQKQYEWLTDIIQDVEDKDTQNILDTHIFITQFPQKFDLRTTMLVSQLLRIFVKFLSLKAAFFLESHGRALDDCFIGEAISSNSCK